MSIKILANICKTTGLSLTKRENSLKKPPDHYLKKLHLFLTVCKQRSYYKSALVNTHHSTVYVCKLFLNPIEKIIIFTCLSCWSDYLRITPPNFKSVLIRSVDMFTWRLFNLISRLFGSMWIIWGIVSKPVYHTLFPCGCILCSCVVVKALI